MFLFVSSSSEFIELSKLPFLVQHYCKHKSEKKSLSLIAFLKLHYSKESKNDNDDNEDSKLPFKTIAENNFTSVYLPAVNENISNAISDHPYFNSKYSCWKPYGLISKIFRPPCFS